MCIALGYLNIKVRKRVPKLYITCRGGDIQNFDKSSL